MPIGGDDMARPAMKKPFQKKKQVSVTVHPDLINVARARGINLSQLLEAAILREISKDKEKECP